MVRECGKMFPMHEWSLDQDEVFAKDTTFVDSSMLEEEDTTEYDGEKKKALENIKSQNYNQGN